MSAKDLVIGLVRGYDIAQLHPFVRSLQQTGYGGDIVLLYNDLSPATTKALTACGVNLRHVYYHGEGAMNSWSVRWPRLAPLGRRLPGWLGIRRISKTILPLMAARFLHYHDYLTKYRGRYRNVLLTDIRDVIFQRDPLTDFSPGIEVFQETGDVLLKNEKTNALWVTELFGPQALAKIGNYPVLCAGTIMGDTDSILGLLGRYERLLYDARHVYMPGSDQGVYNYLCRVLIPEKVRIIKNGLGRVLTLGTLDPSSADIAWNSSGELLGKDRLPAPVIHQYDRHPAIAERLLAKMASPLADTQVGFSTRTTGASSYPLDDCT